MADRGFEQDEDLSLLWKTEGLTYIKTCLHYGRQRVGVIWRLFSIMADRGLSYMKTCLHYRRQRFELYEDFSPLWQTEGLSKMKTCLHYSRKRVSLIWRLFSIMAGRVFELYEDFSPSWLTWLTEGFDLSLLWKTEGLTYMADRGFEQDEDLSLLWKTEGLSKMKIYLYYGKQRLIFVSIMADLYEDLSPLWQTEGLSKMKTLYSRKRVSLIWRLFSIWQAECLADFSPQRCLSYMKTFLHHG